MVIDRRVNVGQTVVAGMNAPSLFLLAKDLGHMLVWSAVNEADIGDIHVGQTVTFKVDAYRDRTFSGKVSQIRLNASLQQNVVTYGVIVDVDNPDGKLLPYMTAKLQFEVARRPNAILVPNQALRWQPTWEQISPSARAGLTPPAAVRIRSAEEDKDGRGRRQRAESGPWIAHGLDGRRRRLGAAGGRQGRPVRRNGDGDSRRRRCSPGRPWSSTCVREAKPDFVSSFVSKVIKQ